MTLKALLALGATLVLFTAGMAYPLAALVGASRPGLLARGASALKATAAIGVMNCSASGAHACHMRRATAPDNGHPT